MSTQAITAAQAAAALRQCAAEIDSEDKTEREEQPRLTRVVARVQVAAQFRRLADLIERP